MVIEAGLGALRVRGPAGVPEQEEVVVGIGFMEEAAMSVGEISACSGMLMWCVRG